MVRRAWSTRLPIALVLNRLCLLFSQNRCRRRKKPNKRNVAFYASKLTDRTGFVQPVSRSRPLSPALYPPHMDR